MSINSISISTEKLSRDAYNLNVKFFKQYDELHSSKEFIFIKNTRGQDKEIVDLYSLNCGLSTDLSSVCSNKDVKCLKQVVHKIDTLSSIIFTLDMKDTQKGYLHEEILLGERNVCEFFSSETTSPSKSLNNARKLLQGKLDFIYCEGTLKSKLLHQFEEMEAFYLNSKEGSQDFCQLAEVFMNAAKFGHVQKETSPEQFICSLSKLIDFQPHQKSTIWYPPLYKNAVDSVITIFQPVFLTASSYEDSSAITTLSMEEKL